MAKRLATQYVHTRLVLTEQDLTHLFAIVHTFGLACSIDVHTDGGCAVVIEQPHHNRCAFRFVRSAGTLLYEGPDDVADARIAHAWRAVIARFRGDATVLRVYATYTLEYVYCAGRVHTITEITDSGRKSIYSPPLHIDAHATMMHTNTVEQRIEAIKARVDCVLDARNAAHDDAYTIARIDAQLRTYAHQLFVYEA
jgi:hypothetical protein